MRFTDASCPYCGEPVIIDRKGRGLCEYCGQWIIYDSCSGRCVSEDDYDSEIAYEDNRYKRRNHGNH